MTTLFMVSEATSKALSPRVCCVNPYKSNERDLLDERHRTKRGFLGDLSPTPENNVISIDDRFISLVVRRYPKKFYPTQGTTHKTYNLPWLGRVWIFQLVVRNCIRE
ncbi:hypothetical protein Scep_001762 [Stephania cephalantha]|uniref:Uncharacterized protein n=1 Tax=Stephania cephalantha TaxID=152367 RepID=A0AAP0Q829_9MAGN